jgi:hypothetical protein
MYILIKNTEKCQNMYRADNCNQDFPVTGRLNEGLNAISLIDFSRKFDERKSFF